MTFLRFLLHPGVLDLIAVFLSIVWMLRDEKDKTRPLLVIALVVNLFYGSLLTFVMGRENGLVPWKYDHVLFRIDRALGLSAPSIAGWMQGAARIPLLLVYQLMVPMMIMWFLVVRRHGTQKSLILAYVTELVLGPLLYALVPGCGPRYAFAANWLRPSQVDSNLVRLSGMPNAFPSLHVGTATIFVVLAPGRMTRVLALMFLALTALATLSTGEHYVIDLVAGLAFGCFAAALGTRNLRRSILLFVPVLTWCLAIRFAHGYLVNHPGELRAFAAVSVVISCAAIWMHWRSLPVPAPPTSETTSAKDAS